MPSFSLWRNFILLGAFVFDIIPIGGVPTVLGEASSAPRLFRLGAPLASLEFCFVLHLDPVFTCFAFLIPILWLAKVLGFLAMTALGLNKTSVPYCEPNTDC